MTEQHNITPDLQIYRPTSTEMIDHQIDLYERLGGDDLQFTIVSILTQGMMTNRNAPHIPPLLHAHVANSALYRLSVDMVSMVEQAAEQLNVTDKFDITMMPSRCGMVRFDRPLVITDIRNNYMLVHVLTWGPVKMKNPDGTFTDAVLFSMWNDINVQLDVYTTRMLADFGDRYRQTFGRWSFIGAESIIDQARVGPVMVKAGILGIVDDDDDRTFTNTFRYFVAMIDMMNQRIVRQDTEQATRPARRRSERRGLSSRSVTIVDIRRTSNSSDSDTTSGAVNWTRRWAVRGHYRRAKVGKGRQEVSRVWVRGHIKGPDDKPLVITTKIYDVK